jgi:hypothetical protein
LLKKEESDAYEDKNYSRITPRRTNAGKLYPT